jgi:hypothetical protein
MAISKPVTSLVPTSDWHMGLFFDRDETAAIFDAPRLMDAARKVMCSKLITGCFLGSIPYITAYFRGFWPFVGQLEQIVDDRPLPREPLNAAVGNRHEAARVLLGITRIRAKLTREEVEFNHWISIRKASHAEYWREDALKRGIQLLSKPSNGVAELIAAFKQADTSSEFFACLVAGEMIALALGEELGHSGAFNALGRSLWVDAHLITPQISALDINMSFMRAYSIAGDFEYLRDYVLRIIGMFEAAADSVFEDI